MKNFHSIVIGLTQPQVFQSCRVIACIVAISLFHGCGGAAVHSVQGKVTLDDKPLPAATIAFSPKNEEGEYVIARTDENGDYRLMLSEERRGALVGEYEVRITTFEAGNPNDIPPQPQVAEKAPAKYNVDTELSATIVEGENTFDFPLKSDGEIKQPDVSMGGF